MAKEMKMISLVLQESLQVSVVALYRSSQEYPPGSVRSVITRPILSRVDSWRRATCNPRSTQASMLMIAWAPL
jgi:hypothetical protein